MRNTRVFLQQSLSVNDIVSLPKDKAHHLTHVLRMKTGDEIKLFNDSGNEFDAIITGLTKKNALAEIKREHRVENESPLKITLCLAISRGQHMDYSIQKAVELGANKIVPLMSEFSNVKLQGDRIQNKMSHWQGIIINATEQCGRCHLTQLDSPIPFNEYLDKNESDICLILHPGSQKAMSSITMDNQSLTIMIGPEGGFSESEIKMSIDKETIPVSIGPRVLRAETAVVTALSNAQQLWGDLN
jgi:16S rRNA (uracil1498-N3)-methyltransferase